MLSLKNLQLAYGSNILIENANLQLYYGQKVGIVGQNGVGKTSLFKLITGELLPEAGDYSLSNNTIIAHVEQEIVNQNQLLVEYVLSIHPLIIHEHTDLPEYYQLRPRAEKLLISLGFKLNELELPIKEFSGGWQMRANLAKALFVPSDILLLDEPTNHLDLETVIWLEDWLKKYQGLALIISHDREFLDNVATHIVLISNKTLTLYTGNYSVYENTRYMQLQQQQQIRAKTEARIAHLQSFVDRFKAKASKAKQAQSRVKMIEKLQVVQAMPKDIEYSIEFLEPEYQIDKLLSINDGVIGYKDKILLKDVKLDIFQNSRIGLLGKNGIGKSTLIKAMINGSTLLSGELYIDKKIKIGYFAQHTVDQLDLTDTPLSWFSRNYKEKKESELRSFLGRYGFSGDKVKEEINNFSGGEKARLTIANIILSRPNILFLDEPTNHLDMQMREEIASSIQDFSGAVIIVSHDKFLLQSVVDEFYLLNNLHLNKFNGDLDDYHQILLNESSDKKIMKISNENSQKTSIDNNTAPLINLTKLKNEINKIEEQITQLQKTIIKSEELMAKINCNTPVQIIELELITKEYNKNKLLLEKLENEWLILQSKIDKEN